MDSQVTRAAAVRQALARHPRASHTSPELELLTQYVLGHLSLEQTNEQLRTLHPALRLVLPGGQPA